MHTTILVVLCENNTQRTRETIKMLNTTNVKVRNVYKSEFSILCHYIYCWIFIVFLGRKMLNSTFPQVSVSCNTTIMYLCVYAIFHYIKMLTYRSTQHLKLNTHKTLTNLYTHTAYIFKLHHQKKETRVLFYILLLHNKRS